MTTTEREYKTLASIGLEYGISEPVASKLVREVESALIKSGKFSLPSKRALYKDDINLDYVIIDATEMPIQRPKKQKIYYSGKKKEHTQKAQIVIDQNQQIICTHIDTGRTHDFKIFKESKLPLKMDTLVKVDLGYVGIQKIHKKCEIPKKKSKNNPLTKEDKELNKTKSSSRIYIEHINAKIKVFQIFTQKYRNRRKRFGLRLNLICALINFDIGFGS